MRHEGCEVILGPPAEQLDGKDWDFPEWQVTDTKQLKPTFTRSEAQRFLVNGKGRNAEPRCNNLIRPDLREPLNGGHPVDVLRLQAEAS